MRGQSVELWEAWRTRGDSSAFKELVGPDLGRAVALARASGCPPGEAEDAVQEALMRLARERGDAPARVGVRGWFFGVVRDRACARRRASRRRSRRESRAAAPDVPAEPIRAGELREEVERALALLEEEDREVVRHRFLLDLEYREVAHVVGATEGACRVRVHRALKRLQRVLGPGAGAVLAAVVFPAPARAVTLISSATAAASTSAGASILAGSLLMTATQRTATTIAAVALCALGVGIGIGVQIVPESPPGAPPPPEGRVSSSHPGDGIEPGRAAPALTVEDVRRVIARELERHAAGGGGRVAREAGGETRDETGSKADPEHVDRIKSMLASLRSVLLKNDMRYEMGPGKALGRPDPARLERFPDERVWPKDRLGWVQTDPAGYVTVGAGGERFDPTREEAGFVFTTPLDRAIATMHPATLVFEGGIASSGVVSLQEGGTILCRGDLAGKMHLDGYATVIIEGALTGNIESRSYTTILVTGELSGAFTSHSYANLRVMGGFSGRMSLFDSNNLYFGGYVPQHALDRIEFMDRATVTFENTDLELGKHGRRPRVTVIVLEP